MIDRASLKSLMAFFAMALFFGLGSLACGSGDGANTKVGTLAPGSPPTTSPSATPPGACGGASDDLIVQAIYGKIALTPNLSAQIKQINITSSGGVVTFYGWVSDATLRAKAISLATTTSCVVKVNPSPSFYDNPINPTRPVNGTCGDQLKPCGDICIPELDKCNLSIDPVPLGNANGDSRGNANSNSAANSNSNSISNSNSNTKS